MTDKVIPMPNEASCMTIREARFVHAKRSFISDDKLLDASATLLMEAQHHQRVVDDCIRKAGECLAYLHTGIRIHMSKEVKS